MNAVGILILHHTDHVHMLQHMLGSCVQGNFFFEMFFLNGTRIYNSYALLPEMSVFAEPAHKLVCR